MKQNLLKTFIAAAAIVLGSTGAMAQDGSKNYATVFKYDFEDASTIAAPWTIQGAVTTSQVAYNSSNFVQFEGYAASMSETIDFSSSVEGITDYIFSYTFGYSPVGSSQGVAGEIMSVYAGDEKILSFESNALGNSTTAGTITVYDATNTSIGTFNVDVRYLPSLTKFYNVEITGNEEYGVALNVTAVGSNTASVSATLSTDYKLITKFVATPQEGKTNFVSRIAFDDIYMGKVATGDFADIPSAKLVSVNGIERTYTISYNEGETLYYVFSTTGEEPTEYQSITGATSFDYTAKESGTLYAYTTKGTAVSDKLTVPVDATEIQLNAPTYEKTKRADGCFTVALATNQSTVLLSPNATIMYRIGDTGDFAVYNAPISVPEGENFYAYSVATGYTNSEQIEAATLVVPTTQVSQWNIDFTGYSSVDYSEEQVEGYYKLTVDGAIINDNFLVEPANGDYKFMMHQGGLYAFYGGTRVIAFDNMEKGDYIRVTYSKGDGLPYANSNVTKIDGMSCTGEDYFQVDADGFVKLNIYRYTHIYTVEVFKEADVATIGSAGAATYAPKANVLVPEGVTAYTVTVNDDQTSVTITEVNGALQAGKGYVIEGAEGTYSFTYAGDVAVENNANNLIVAEEGGKTAAAADNLYILAQRTDGSVGFSRVKAETTIPAGKAYLDLGVSASAKPAFLTIGQPTAVEGVEAAAAAAPVEYISLQGIRTTTPKGGIYIVNGKAVLVK